MSDPKNRWTRRDFFKTVAMAGAGSMMAPVAQVAEAAETKSQVPQRPFGKSGINVSILSLGGMFNIKSNQIMLKQAMRWGVTYWDTADSYHRGSEKGIGKYFSKYPEDRKKVFLVTKSDSRDPKGMSKLLERSLDKMKTDYIDLYFVHGVYSTHELDQSIRTWAEEAKAAGKIRLFGFSSHSNMEKCMLAAARLGWIDGIMMTYNYRLMQTDAMQRAVEACVKAGIGLTAMKTQGGEAVRTDSETELKLAGRFMQKGFTEAQAKLMAVWQNPAIASICSQMPNMSILMANTAAAMDKTKLSATDAKLLQQYAHETRKNYCAGCTGICESAIAEKAPIGDVMRYLMYCRSYGDRAHATAEYRKIPPKIRARLTGIDYSTAEQKCPQKMAIAQLMQEAADELS
ncbi:MAG: aldo/keto reductase [bacterium]|nr:aldo/keto reductase [bacterium]